MADAQLLSNDLRELDLAYAIAEGNFSWQMLNKERNCKNEKHGYKTISSNYFLDFYIAGGHAVIYIHFLLYQFKG